MSLFKTYVLESEMIILLDIIKWEGINNHWKETGVYDFDEMVYGSL